MKGLPKSKHDLSARGVRRANIPPQVLLAVLLLACLTPFLGKAFHIDDTLFVWAARQIALHPSDPFRFNVNWHDKLQPMWEVTKNPPLASYYIAAAAGFVGWSEAALHAAFLLPALAAVLGTYYLARRFTRGPVLAAAATLAAPGFLVSSTSVMCDTMMLALWILAILFWLDGLDSRRPALLAVSSALIAACALTKYFGIALIPLLLVYSIARQRRVGAWIAYLLLPVGVLAGYQCWTSALYGSGLLWGAAEYARSLNGVSAGKLSIALYKTAVGLSFAGGCALPALTFAPVLWPRRWILPAAAAVGLAGFILGMGAAMPPSVAHDYRTFLSLQLALFIAGGMSALALAFSDWRRHKDPLSLLLLLWVAGTLVFASFLNWTVNARSVLPIIPAVAILLARRLEAVESLAGKPRLAKLAAPLVVSGAIALWVAWGDASLANSARTAAQYLGARLSSPATSVSFEGHWGFQYYMQAFSFRPVDFQKLSVGNGDLLVVPGNNTFTSVQSIPSHLVASQVSLAFPMNTGVTTVSTHWGACFYSDLWGPLPYAFGPTPAENYTVLRLHVP